jgi:outer membrane protein assembly factor BamB
MGKTTRFVLLLWTLGLTTMEAQPPQGWGQWRGPGRNGTGVFDVSSTLPDALTKRWEVTVGLGHSSPVVENRRVVIHTREGDREVTRAFDLLSGKELWRHDFTAPYTMNPAARAHGPGPKSTPVIAGDRVFTLGITGVLSALDLASGKLLWRTDPPPAPPEYGTAMSPIVEPPNVIVHVGAQDKGALTAFDIATGKPRWRWTGDGPAYASPIAASINGRRQLITQTENFVVGLDAANGQLLWQIPFRTSYDQNAITPLVVKDLLIYSGLDSGTTAVRLVQKGTAWVTEPVWKNEQVSMYMSSPVVVGSTLYGLSHRSRGQFFAIDLASGKTLWTTPGREGDNASLVVVPAYLLLSTTEGELIVARPNPSRFEEVKRYRIAESAVWAHPAITGSVILVKDVDKLICWSV